MSRYKGNRWRLAEPRGSEAPRGRSGLLLVALTLASFACNSGPETRSGWLSGRALVAPGVPLVGATILVDSVDHHDGRGALRRRVAAEALTDEEGYFETPTYTASGVLMLTTSGGTFHDPFSGRLIELDRDVGMNALHWLARPFGTAEQTHITPMHALVEARFRRKVIELRHVRRALAAAYAQVGEHFGNVEWEHIEPADLQQPAPSPTEKVRASWLLGGFALLAADMREASGATENVVNVMTLIDMAKADLREGELDGNDANDRAPGSGLQVGECEAVPPTCQVKAPGCQLSACRSGCDLFANTFRDGLAAAVRKYIGPASYPTRWNRTGLSSADAKLMLDALQRNADPDLFGDACIETADRSAPTITWEVLREGRWQPLPEGELVRGALSVRALAYDDAEAVPSIVLEGLPSERPGPVATTIIDTVAESDGTFSLVAIAHDAAGNQRRSTRSLEIDNTAPVLTLESGGFYVDSQTGQWWTADSAPVMRGTLTELHADKVEVVIEGVVVATAALEGESWVVAVPAGKVPTSGAEVTIRATDGAGNVGTVARSLRLDTTPPSLLVEPSVVYDEANSAEFYDLDNPATNTWLQRHVTGGAPIDLAQSMPPACVTVRKFSHLLFQELVLGSTGNLNPLRLSLVASDDGVGVARGTEQLRVTVRNGASTVEVLPWSTMAGIPLGGNATRFVAGLYRDGPQAIPSLGSMEGEYHVELRATDKLGRTVVQERCWNHRILAPKLRSAGTNPDGGAQATGFAQAMFSTSLNPVGGQFGDVSAKFLNSNAAGAAIWAWRVRNYLGVPIYVRVKIPMGVNAYVSKTFTVGGTVVQRRTTYEVCGVNPCGLTQPTTTDHSVTNALHQNVRFRARAYAAAGAVLGAEILPCAGCINDEATQTYMFEIPARVTSQGTALAEYVITTHLVATQPAGAGLDVLMAPSSPASPDSGSYGEVLLNGATFTGRLNGAPSAAEYCIAQEFDSESGRWACTEKGRTQGFRALRSVKYKTTVVVNTEYQLSPASQVPPTSAASGILLRDATWETFEGPLP